MLSRDNALYLIHHIFLPPQLPHKDDDGERCGHLLLRITRDALLDFNHSFANNHGVVDAQIAIISRMMNIHSNHTANDVLELELQKALSGLTKSGNSNLSTPPEQVLIHCRRVHSALHWRSECGCYHQQGRSKCPLWDV